MGGFDASTLGKNVGLQVWRIENFDVVPYKTDGAFNSGDAYVVLNTYKSKSGSIGYDVHFWLGAACTQDESGTAALKTVECDDLLNGKPVQYREVEGHESELFISYFKGGLKYLEGGIASGFRVVDRDHKPTRLFHVKGKRNARCRQVSSIKASEMNDGDVFVLDTGKTVYQWNGKCANKYEKVKGAELVHQIRNDDHGGKASVSFIGNGASDQDEAAFWAVLGSEKDVQSAESGGDDEESKSEHIVSTVDFSDGAPTFSTQTFNTLLDKKVLDTNAVIIVDVGSEVFVWVGKNAPAEGKKKALNCVGEYLASNKRPNHLPVSRIVEGGEPLTFQTQFLHWKTYAFKPKEVAVKQKAADDVSALYDENKQEVSQVLTTEGKLKVWRIENFDKAEVPKEQYGQFFSGDSYIVFFEYSNGGKPAYFIYFWQGRDSSQDEKGASALLTAQLDQEYNNEPVQVRVVQNKEPDHFLALFKGRMIVHSGGVASAFKNSKESVYTVDENALYHIKGTTASSTRAIQVACRPDSLNSGDCFALLTKEEVTLWIGKYSSDEEKATAANIADILKFKRSVKSVDEGSEEDSFWEPLGGKGEYTQARSEKEVVEAARLFHCTTAVGKFKATEVFNFCQDDLIKDDVFILDAGAEVFVWVGQDSTQEEREKAQNAALDFVDKKAPGTTCWKVLSGTEPPNFTAHFLGWDLSKAKDFSDPYLAKIKAMRGNSSGSEESKEPSLDFKRGSTIITRDNVSEFAASKTYSLDALKTTKPADVDPTKKEHYLSNEEFATVFKQSKEDFAKLPKWKQDAAKKSAGLF